MGVDCTLSGEAMGTAAVCVTVDTNHRHTPSLPAAHTLPVVEARSTPVATTGQPCHLLVGPIREIITRAVPPHYTPRALPGGLGTRDLTGYPSNQVCRTDRALPCVAHAAALAGLETSPTTGGNPTGTLELDAHSVSISITFVCLHPDPCGNFSDTSGFGPRNGPKDR